MAEHNTTGKEGEEIAKKYLEKKGYKIIEQNYRTKRAEIDIVARLRQGFHLRQIFGGQVGGQSKDILVFVEVRTKHHEHYGTPEDTITYKKRLRLQRNAAAYVHRIRYNGPWRIDAVCLVLAGKEVVRIQHYESIVES